MYQQNQPQYQNYQPQYQQPQFHQRQQPLDERTNICRLAHMNSRLVNLCIYNKNIEGITGHVLMTIGLHQGRNRNTFVSQETLATECGTSRRTISRTINALIKLGYLFIDDNNGKTRKYYSVNIERLMKENDAVTGYDRNASKERSTVQYGRMTYSSQQEQTKVESVSFQQYGMGKMSQNSGIDNMGKMSQNSGIDNMGKMSQNQSSCCHENSSYSMTTERNYGIETMGKISQNSSVESIETMGEFAQNSYFDDMGKISQNSSVEIVNPMSILAHNSFETMGNLAQKMGESAQVLCKNVPIINNNNNYNNKKENENNTSSPLPHLDSKKEEADNISFSFSISSSECNASNKYPKKDNLSERTSDSDSTPNKKTSSTPKTCQQPKDWEEVYRHGQENGFTDLTKAQAKNWFNDKSARDWKFKGIQITNWKGMFLSYCRIVLKQVEHEIQKDNVQEQDISTTENTLTKTTEQRPLSTIEMLKARFRK